MLKSPDAIQDTPTEYPPNSPATWRPAPSAVGPLGIVAVFFLLTCFAIARIYTLHRPMDPETLTATVASLASLVLAVLVAILTYASYSLRYRLTAHELSIEWLWNREVIPLGRIDGVYKGTRLGEKLLVRGIGWPGFGVETLETGDFGRVKFYGSSMDTSRIVLITTGDSTYAITPADAEGFRNQLIERLEATAGEMPQPPDRMTAIPSILRLSPLSLWFAGVSTAAIALSAAVLWSVMQIPVPVPDTFTGTGASSTADINDWTSVGHSFQMDRDGLCRIDVVLSTLKRTESADIQFHIREEARGPNLRSLRIRLDSFPEGKVLDLYNTRWQDLPWVSFEFEPLHGYAGKPLYFNIEGKDVPRANTVQALFAYPNSYGRGEAHTSEKPAGANMVFRTYTKGNLSDLLETTFPMLSRGRPGLLGVDAIYQSLALAGFILVGLLFRGIARLGDNQAHQ